MNCFTKRSIFLDLTLNVLCIQFFDEEDKAP